VPWLKTVEQNQQAERMLATSRVAGGKSSFGFGRRERVLNLG
jgi:hypothetical protein